MKSGFHSGRVFVENAGDCDEWDLEKNWLSVGKTRVSDWGLFFLY